jgi:hypothetical protein
LGRRPGRLVAPRRTQSSSCLEQRATEAASHSVAPGVFAEQLTEDLLPPRAGHLSHVTVERCPPKLHLVIGDYRLIRLAVEVESFEGWHAVMLSLGTSILRTFDA